MISIMIVIIPNSIIHYSLFSIISIIIDNSTNHYIHLLLLSFIHLLLLSFIHLLLLSFIHRLLILNSTSYESIIYVSIDSNHSFLSYHLQITISYFMDLSFI